MVNVPCVKEKNETQITIDKTCCSITPISRLYIIYNTIIVLQIAEDIDFLMKYYSI